jgi:hypothetical protein
LSGQLRSCEFPKKLQAKTTYRQFLLNALNKKIVFDEREIECNNRYAVIKINQAIKVKCLALDNNQFLKLYFVKRRGLSYSLKKEYWANGEYFSILFAASIKGYLVLFDDPKGYFIAPKSIN